LDLATDGAQMNTDQRQIAFSSSVFDLCSSVPHLWLILSVPALGVSAFTPSRVFVLFEVE
jgi:hypothetical protein